MTTVLITYAGDATTRFDRDYYSKAHLPLVMEAWGRHGLETTAAFFPSGDGAGTIAICICEFKDEAAIQASLNSPQIEQVMADVHHFTDAKPAQRRAIPV